MKNSILIAIAGLAIGGASTTAMAHEPTYYGTRRALVSSVLTDPSLSPRMRVAQEQSTRNSLLTAQRVASKTEARPTPVAFYNTKNAGAATPVRG